MTRLPTIAAAAAALRAGDVTSVDLVEDCLDRIDRDAAELGAFAATDAESALLQARAADERIARGAAESLPPLLGIPLAIKDMIAVAGFPTRANSRVLAGGWGTGQDAPVAARLRRAGAVFIGKATTSEFAVGHPEAGPHGPIPRNPWNEDYSPAGSSSGTAIAVVAGFAFGGLGTDTGGSVRAPSAATGSTGLKPTFGRVPKNGVVPLGLSLDTVGPMAASAEDCALLLDTISGYDAGDPTSTRRVSPPAADGVGRDVAGMRIGVSRRFFFDHPALDPEIAAGVLGALDLLEGAGARPVGIELDNAELARDAYHITLVAEGFAVHRERLRERWEDYGPSARLTLARGALLGAADLVQAQRFRAAFALEVARAFEQCDVIVTPTAAQPAEPLDGLSVSSRLLTPNYTSAWNLTGLPAIAVPVGFTSAGLPMSMQIVGRPFAEDVVVRVADAFQRLTDWHLRRPARQAAGAA